MALTMTRTRTQSALTALVKLVSEARAEVLLLEALDEVHHGAPAVIQRLAARRAELEAFRLTVRQFDPEIDPDHIMPTWAWLRQPRKRSSTSCVVEYLKRRFPDQSHSGREAAASWLVGLLGIPAKLNGRP